MTVATTLERLARLVPGIGGYHDRESARDADHEIRMQVAAELERCKRALEAAAAELTAQHVLAPLAAVGRLIARLDHIGNSIRYAARGYRGVFDANPVDREALERLAAFDRGLAESLGAVTSATDGLLAAATPPEDKSALGDAMTALGRTLDELEARVADRGESAAAE
jgi:hypothetical protein